MTDKMVTRCPHCRTAFRIYQHQIEQRRGTVRCGACGGIFDARQHLSMRSGTVPIPVPSPQTPAADSTASARAAAASPRPAAASEKRRVDAVGMPAGGPVQTERDRPARPESAVGPGAERGAWPAEHEWHAGAAHAAPRPAAEGVSPKAEAPAARDWEWPAARKGRESTVQPPGVQPTEAASPAPVHGEQIASADVSSQTAEGALAAPRIEQRADVPVKVYQAERVTRPPRRGRRWGREDLEFGAGARSLARVIGYSAVVGLLGLVLVVQATLWLRSDIAGHFPDTRTFLSQICRPFQCEVSLPRNIDDLVIDASDLRAEDGVLTLTATLRNRGSMMLALPIIELTITDEHGDAVALRRLMPTDYLGARAQTFQGIAAGGELSVVVHIDGSQLAANGYRLLVLYA